jgi:hypothetical protein
MTPEFRTAIALVLGLGLSGLAACSAPETEPAVAGRGEHPSQAGQALDQRSDRPAAAAVGVLVDSAVTAALDHELRATRQLWLFACNSDHQLVRSVRPDRQAKWGAWTIEAGAACAGPPSASAWSESPHDSVEVVFRSTDNHLIELAYNGGLAAYELDLSKYTHFGELANNCNPVIADMGTQSRVSIALRNPSNQLFTLTAYGTVWHAQPARGADGGQVFAESTLVSWYSDRRALLSAVHNGMTQSFNRYTWKQGFRAFNAPIPAEASHGLITFTSYHGRVQALGKDARGALVSAPVDQSWSFSPAPARSFLQSTVYLGAPYAYRAGQSANAAAVGIALGSTSNAAFISGFDFLKPTVAAPATDNTRVASANAVVANPGPELWGDNFVADADDQLLWWNGGTDRTFTPMGQTVLY